jgi:hypothetical protein
VGAVKFRHPATFRASAPSQEGGEAVLTLVSSESGSPSWRPNRHGCALTKPRLRSLNLAGTHLGAAGAASLAPSLALMSQLTSLNLGGDDLGYNDIGAAGAASLAPSLALMAQLTSLNTSGGFLKAVSLVTLCREDPFWPRDRHRAREKFKGR